MTRNEQNEIETALSVLRNQAEELHARLMDAHPHHAEKFGKIAHYAGKLGTCLRVHGTLPLDKPAPSLVQAARSVTAIHAQLKKLPLK